MESEENDDIYNLIISFGERGNEHINTDNLNKDLANASRSLVSNAGGTEFIFTASPIFDSSFLSSNYVDERTQINEIVNEMMESIEYLFSLNSNMLSKSTNTNTSHQSEINYQLSTTLPSTLSIQRLDINTHFVENNPTILSSFNLISPRPDHSYDSSITALTLPANAISSHNTNTNYNDQTIPYTKTSYPNTNYNINNNNNNNSLNINIDPDDTNMTNMIEKRNNRRNRRKEKNIELKQYLAVVGNNTIYMYCLYV